MVTPVTTNEPRQVGAEELARIAHDAKQLGNLKAGFVGKTAYIEDVETLLGHITAQEAENAELARTHVCLRTYAVTERLPEEGEYVLVSLNSHGGGVCAGQYADTFNGPPGFIDLDGNYFDEGDVSHWSRMPDGLDPTRTLEADTCIKGMRAEWESRGRPAAPWVSSWPIAPEGVRE